LISFIEIGLHQSITFNEIIKLRPEWIIAVCLSTVWHGGCLIDRQQQEFNPHHQAVRWEFLKNPEKTAKSLFKRRASYGGKGKKEGRRS
jgi:hypothetical protein